MLRRTKAQVAPELPPVEHQTVQVDLAPDHRDLYDVTPQRERRKLFGLLPDLDPWWNPQAERQAVDRAHRIGQRRPVTVRRLVAAGTIEEKVLALQQGKQTLFDAVVDDGDPFSASLTADDVRDLLA